MNIIPQSAPNSAALGGAYRAKYVSMKKSGGTTSFSSVMETVADTAKRVASPNKDAAKIYAPLLERYRKLEQETTLSEKC